MCYHWWQSILLFLTPSLYNSYDNKSCGIFFSLHPCFSHSVCKSFLQHARFNIFAFMPVTTLKQSLMIDILAWTFYPRLPWFIPHIAPATKWSLLNKRLGKIPDISSNYTEIRFTTLMFMSTDLTKLIMLWVWCDFPVTGNILINCIVTHKSS